MESSALLFTIFCVFAVGLILFGAAYDNLVWLLICLTVFLCITQFGFKYDVLTYAQNNVGLIATLAGIYLLLGIVYAFFRWWKFVKDAVVIRNQSFDRFIEWLKTRDEYKINPFSDQPDMENNIRKFLRNISNGIEPNNSDEEKFSKLYLDRFNDVTKPQISHYKDRFISWFLFWPFSAIIFVLNDFMREVFESIYYFFAKKLQSISDKIWSD